VDPASRSPCTGSCKRPSHALKHAGAAAVEVRLLFARTSSSWNLHTGRGRNSARARSATACWGCVKRDVVRRDAAHGPRPGGGYRVYAKIPVDITERQLAS